MVYTTKDLEKKKFKLKSTRRISRKVLTRVNSSRTNSKNTLDPQIERWVTESLADHRDAYTYLKNR